MGEELKDFDNSAENETKEVRKRVASLVRGRGDRWDGKRRRQSIVVGDNAVDLNDDVVDLRNERMEGAQNDAALTQGLDIADPIKDQENDKVRKTVEVVNVGLWL